MEKFYQFLKKRGFTLAEALVVTILVGYIMVPIVGTMQNGILRTQNFNHREKLRTLAKSRLNKEVSFGAFDLKAIDTSPSYHYVYYNTATEPKLLTLDSHLASNSYIASDGSVLASAPASISAILYSYKTEIEIKENLEVESLSGVATYSGSLRGLKAIVVKSELEPNDNVVATESVSFFSLVNVPSFSEEFIWLANNKFLEIYSIDSISRTKVETFDVPKIDTSKPADDGAQDPNRPVHTVVHPNGKFLLIQGRHKLFALNINKASQYYGDFHEIYDRGDHISDVKDNDKNKAMERKGIALRPDGKRFFFTVQQDKTVKAYKITDPESWPPTFTSIADLDLKNETPGEDCDEDKFRDFVAGNDGWLYLALKGKKKAIRFPMYADYSKYGNKLPWQILDDNDLGGNGSGTDDEAWGIETSQDGKEVYVLWKEGNGGYITRFNSKTREITGRVKVNCNNKETRDFVFSADNNYWAFSSDHDDAAKSGFYFWEHNPSSFDNLSTTQTVSTVNTFTEKNKTRNLLQSPVLTEVIADPEKKPNIYFIDYEKAENGDYTKGNGGLPPARISNITPYEKSHVSMSARGQQIVAVGTGAGNNSIRFIDAYSGNEYKDRTIDLATTTPTNIGLSQNGAEAYFSFDATRPGFTKAKTIFKAGDDPILSFSLGSADSYKVAISEDPDNPGLYANGEYDASTPGYNGYWIPGAPVPSGLPNDQCRDVDFTTNWEFQDIEAIPGGGFFILFKDSNAPNNCLLDWIGKMQWGADKGKYKRFARWRTQTDNFPATNSISLAISPDGGLLAIEQKGSPQKVHLYDLNSCKFGHWTQLNGLVAEYRQNDNIEDYNYEFPVAASCSFDVSAPAPDTGRNLASCTTSNDSWRSFQDYPANYTTGNSTTSDHNPDSNKNRADAIKRFFGYYIPDHDVSKFGIAQRDPWRFHLDGVIASESLNSDPTVGEELYYTCNEFQRYPFQINHKDNTGDRVVGLFVPTSPGSDPAPSPPTPVAGDSLFDDDYNEMTNYDKIASTSFRPFQFVPAHIATYDMTGCNDDDDGAMVFSRDTSDPVLFFADTINDYIWAIKIGHLATPIDLGSRDFTNNQLAVSNDGGVLIYAREDNDTVCFVDISEPNNTSDNFNFDGSTHSQSIMTGFGREMNTVQLDAEPSALATLPFNRYSSASTDGNYKSVATMTFSIAGCNNAAVASGGIYVMGGATGLLETPTNRVLLFQPHENVASYINGVFLNRAMRLHSTAAYDGKIYAFNGYATDTSGPIAWVQSYNVETGKARSSWDDPTTSSEIRVNKYMTSDTTPTPAIATDSGNIYWTYHGWQAFDGTSSSGSGWTTNGTSGEYIIYDSGNSFLSFIVNKLWIHNALGDPNGGTKDFTFSGYDGISWSLLATGTVPYASTGFNYSFNNSTPYQKYKFQMDSAHGSAISYGVREIEFFHENIRRVSPIYMSGYASGSVTVSASADKSGEEAWRAFDGVDNSNSYEWDTDGGGAHWLKMDLGSPDNVNIIGFCNSDDGVASFSLLASNDNFTTSVNIPLVSGDFQGRCPDNTGWQYFYFTNTSDYQYYKLDFPDSWGPDPDLEPWEIRFFSTQTTPPATEPILSKTMNNYRTPVKLQAGAACTTPYGIVIAGGLDHTGNATTSAMVYWPHATDYYNSATDQQWGICSSLPPISNVSGHCLVWHKGYLYRVGGSSSDTKDDALYNIHKFDFETNEWIMLHENDNGDGFTDPNAWFGNRFMAGACSLGDEIFIFGGQQDDGTIRTNAAAWNPETEQVRLLGDIPHTIGNLGLVLPHTLAITAVSYGPYIYLIGGSLPTSTSVGKEIIRFSP